MEEMPGNQGQGDYCTEDMEVIRNFQQEWTNNETKDKQQIETTDSQKSIKERLFR